MTLDAARTRSAPRTVSLLTAAIFSVVLGALLLIALFPVFPRQFDIRAGDTASRTLRSPRAVSFVSDTLTEQRRQEAAQAVPPTLVFDGSIEARQDLRDAVPKLGLEARTPKGEPLRALGERILAIAESGLNARARLNASGDNESGFLDPLREVLASAKTPAERLLHRYRGEWGGDISRIYEEESF